MEKTLRWLMLIYVYLVLSQLHSTAQSRSPKSNEGVDESLSYSIDIEDKLEVFRGDESDASYRITLCADVPNNKKPWRVALRQETGHVFLILQKIRDVDTISQVFGFYPKKGLPTLFFKKIKSKIKDNSKRTYDAGISKQISKREFDTVVTQSIRYSRRLYHINKFNCYDYALAIFNSAVGDDTLATKHIRFPFIFGRGGSPCSLYEDLKRMKESNTSRDVTITFGDLVAPASTARNNKKDD